MAKEQAQSKYAAKRNRAMYRINYSGDYLAWLRVAKAAGAGTDHAQELACAHWKRFGPRPPRTAIRMANYLNPCRGVKS